MLSTDSPRSSEGLRATARVDVVRIGSASRCSVIQSMPPLTFRSTPTPVAAPASAAARGEARLTWVGTAAGPIGGDQLHLDLHVGVGGALRVDSAGAALVLPGPHGTASSLSLTVSVEDGAALIWRPEPTILAAGCRHTATTRVSVGTGCTVVWLEELVLGRHDEEPGMATTRLVVDRNAVPLLRTGLDIGTPGWRGPGGVGADARIVSQVFQMGDRVEAFDPPPGTSAVVSELGADAQLVTIVSSSTIHGRALAASILAQLSTT